MTEKLIKWDDVYKVGTIAYTVFFNPGLKKVKCEACKGKGYITLNGNKFECIKCCGYGNYDKDVDEGWEVDNTPDVITKVEIEKSEEIDKYRVSYWFSRNSKKRADDVFLTKNAAIEECNKRNGVNHGI